MDGEPAVIAVVMDEFPPAQLHIENLDRTTDVGKDAAPIAQHKATGNVGKISQLRAHDAGADRGYALAGHGLTAISDFTMPRNRSLMIVASGNSSRISRSSSKVSIRSALSMSTCEGLVSQPQREKWRIRRRVM